MRLNIKISNSYDVSKPFDILLMKKIEKIENNEDAKWVIALIQNYQKLRRLLKSQIKILNSMKNTDL
jgi:hypothetical protein